MSISLDGNLGVYTSGNVSATGNITTDGYVLGNGALLTGIVSSNVDLGNISQNVIPSQNVTYSLGNATNQWKDLWISNNTIYINSLPLSTIEVGNVTTIEFDGNPIVVSSNTAPPQTANISTTAAVVANEIVANSFAYANGAPFTGYTDADVSTYLASGNNTAGYSTTGNVTANLLIGDGSQITNLPAGNYSNTNVAAYLASNTDTTITTIFLDIGNTNANVANLTTTVANTNANVANNTSNITTLQGQVYGNANVSAYLGNANTTGNIYATNINAANTVTATTFIGNFQGNITGNLVVPGANTWVIYNNAGNAGADIGFRYDAATQDVVVGNTVTANFFVGDGSQLTGLPAAYGNANVEAYLPTSNTIIAINSNVANTNSNVANLTLTVANLATTSALANTDANVANLTTSLGNTNANVANLVTITTNTDSNVANLTTSLANTDSNVANLTLTVANLATTSSLANTNSNVANTDANVANLSSATANNTSNIAQLTIAVAEGVTALGNTNANVANTDSNVANLQSQVNALPVINTIPSVYLTAVANGNGQSFTNVILGGYTSNTSMTAFLNGALLENTFYELAGDVLTVNTYLNTGDNIDVITTLASNVNNVTSGYGNSNVALFFNNYAGNIVPATTNAYQLGTVSNVWLAVYANSISSDALSVNGDILVAGNANIQGNLTYTNITNLTTANLVLGLGNNQTGFNVTGAGIVVGNTNEAALLYNFSTQSWDSNISISAVGNVAGNYFIGNGSQLTGILATTSTKLANGTSNVSILNADGNIDFTVNGNSAGRFTTTGSIVLGNATGNVGNNTIALNGLNTTFNTPRSGGFYAVPVWGGPGVAIPGTSPTSGVVNAMYYDFDTSEINFAPSMQYSQFLAPFSTPTMTAAQAGGINQASATGPILPAANSVPVGTTITFISSGTGTGVRPVVGDFIFINNTNINSGGLFVISPNESAVFVSRGPGTTEWDVFGTACAKYSVANNNTYGAINKIGIPAPTGWNTTVTMDYWEWQMQDDGYLYVRTTSGSHNYAASSTTVFKLGINYSTSAGTTNGTVTASTTFVKQWNQYAGLSVPGESVVVLMEDADSGAVYRITSIKNNSTPNRGALIVERLI